MHRPQSCADFLIQFLVKRNLKTSTGKPLYSYKTSQLEYESLKTLLSKPTSVYSKSTCACFVLFAAEWWRRNYAGGPWGWNGIFQSLQKDHWDTPNIRQQVTRTGLDYWKRSVFQRANGDRAYLGSIFNEAGLPIGLLLNPVSQIRELVVRTFEQQQAYQSEDTTSLVREAVHNLNLADSLQTDAFYELIGQVVSGLLSLKKDYKLGQQADPLAYLQQNVPGWQEQLPLWLDHNAKAGAFLGELLAETARIKRREPTKITVTYRLIQLEDVWRLRATLCIPDGRHQAEALSLTQDEFGQLPDKVLIKVTTGQSERRLDYAFKHGDELSIRGLTNVDLPASVSTAPWQLALADSNDESIATLLLPYNDGLPTDVPWVFVQNETGDWVLKGTGSVRLRADRARIVCPRSIQWQNANEDRTYIGNFSNEQVIYEICGSVLLQDLFEDQSFQIRLTQATDEPYVYMLLPQPGINQLTYFPQLHSHVYVGFPRLFRMHTISGTRSPVASNRIECKLRSAWEPLQSAEIHHGRYRIRAVDADGAVVYSREISVLPTAFSVYIDQKNPAIVLRQSGLFTVSVSIGEEDLSTQISRDANGHRVTLLRDNKRDRIRIRLLSPACQAIDLHVPFPSANAYFTDKIDAQLPQDSQLSMRELYGNSLLLHNTDTREKMHDVLFRLEGFHKLPAIVEIRRQVRLKPSSAELIPLFRFQDDIRRLSSYADSVDAKVRVSVPTSPVSPRLWVTQHTFDTIFDQPTRTVRLKTESQAGQNINIQAFRLDEPFDAAQVLQLDFVTEGWIFPQSCQGKWFYYAASNSGSQIRPKVAVLETSDPEERETVMAMHEASNLSWQNRQDVLHKLFNCISCDFSHTDWSALDAIYTHTTHLSLQAFDAWKALISSNGGLVCFFLRSNTDRIERFTSELSINWYRIPISVWQRGINAYQNYFLGVGLPESVANSVIDSKLTELAKGFKLESLEQILRMSCLRQAASPEFSFGSTSFLVKKVLNDSIVGQQSIPGLINRHLNVKFPTDLAEELRSCLRQLPESVGQLIPDLKNQPYIGSLVYLPAVLAYYSVCPDALDIYPLAPHLVAKLIDFDADHFYFFFNLIQSFCWQTLAH